MPIGEEELSFVEGVTKYEMPLGRITAEFSDADDMPPRVTFKWYYTYRQERYCCPVEIKVGWITEVLMNGEGSNLRTAIVCQFLRMLRSNITGSD